ncbi:MAG TPA: CHAD domain-containing protein [Terracidiphilus sp.]|nr:CHAD domain-containing protein [Terracidiphilus sp.]
MRVDLQEAAKPLRKLRKLLKDVPANPRPELIHNLRTQSRRVEATVHALSPTRDATSKRLLKLMKPVRKTAGRVRDMDVLIARTLNLTSNGAEESLVRLAEEMAAQRTKHAGHLRRIVRRDGEKIRRCLKDYGRKLRRTGGNGTAETLAAPEILAAQLQHWPRLGAGNLHEFRIHAKELQYMLKLAPGMDNHALDGLMHAKDAAGDWHDWVELRYMALTVLDPHSDATILSQIAAVVREKLRVALNAANAARRQVKPGSEIGFAASGNGDAPFRR